MNKTIIMTILISLNCKLYTSPIFHTLRPLGRNSHNVLTNAIRQKFPNLNFNQAQKLASQILIKNPHGIRPHQVKTLIDKLAN